MTTETVAQAITRVAKALKHAELNGYASEQYTDILTAQVMDAAKAAGLSEDVVFMDMCNELADVMSN